MIRVEDTPGEAINCQFCTLVGLHKKRQQAFIVSLPGKPVIFICI
jgi:hypothetical protein